MESWSRNSKGTALQKGFELLYFSIFFEYPVKVKLLKTSTTTAECRRDFGLAFAHDCFHVLFTAPAPARESEVPTSETDDSQYFHVKYAVKKEINPKHSLPDYCILTRKIEHGLVDHISLGQYGNIDTALFEIGELEEAWRIIGEQPEGSSVC